MVYILECSDGSLYAGITTDLKRRIGEHNEGSGAKYTRARRPVTLVYSSPCENRSKATKRELEIKRLSRQQKLRLIDSQ